jgi:D-alanine-D-alanine ligase-like ATP-grasp enzyme
MPDDIRLILSSFEGPNLHAPFAAAVVEFRHPGLAPLPASRIEERLRAFLSADYARRVALPLVDGEFETVAAALASALQDVAGPQGLAASSTRTADGLCRIVLGCHDTLAASLALQAGIRMTAALFANAAGRPVNVAELNAMTATAVARVRMLQPDPLAHSLQRAAHRRGIPVYAVAPGSKVWQYGQGQAGKQFLEAANHADSLIGAHLARNKLFSNKLVARLGLPGVTHGLVDSAEAAVRLARQLGFPLVVKPLDKGKGQGVTAHITTEPEVLAAFAAAHTVSPGKVLVERFVAGDDYRLAVIGGRFAWATRRSPPRITGDGRQTVAELIATENARRAQAPNPDIAGAAIAADAEVHAVLRRQGLALEDRPAAGAVVTLRQIASTSRGGTISDCTQLIHPDNRAMAETIARAFHLDAAGIDFMTPDLSRSWREVDCAVLEVNSTPGFSSDERAELILELQFPGRDGRIPSVVLIGAAASACEQAVAALAARGLRVGWTDGESTALAGERRCRDATPLSMRTLALLLDPACDALVVRVTPAEIEQFGFPLDRCDVAIVATGAVPPGPLAELVARCARAVVADMPPGQMDDRACRAIEALAARASDGAVRA